MRWLTPLWRGPRGGGADLETLVERGFVAVDLETTGLDPRVDTVVAAAAIPIVGGRAGAGYVTLVNPGRAIPASSTAIHGITDAMVAEAPPIAAVLDALDVACADRIVLGHGIDFDLQILARERRRFGRPARQGTVLCTMKLAAAVYPGWADVGLDAVATRLEVAVRGRHTPRGDAEAAADVFMALLPGIRARGIHTVKELVWLQSTATLAR
jgi:DNA polymerase III epsilon subunit family exonuclease